MKGRAHTGKGHRDMERDDMHIVEMRSEDIPAGMRLKESAGWNQTEDDWRLFLEANPGGCFAAVLGGVVIGTVTTIRYGEALSWIGMMLVDPAHRRRGVGTRLMRRALAHLAGGGTVKLDATPLGRTMYEGLGFKDEYTLHRMTVERCRAWEPPPEVVPMTEEHTAGVFEMDAEVFGADRTVVLKNFISRRPEWAWVLPDGNGIGGYCMGRAGTRFHQVGPLVAGTTDDAVRLLHAVSGSLAGRAAVMDVPACQEEFLCRLGEAGFEKERSFTRMFRGGECPGIPGKVFATAGPEFG